MVLLLNFIPVVIVLIFATLLLRKNMRWIDVSRDGRGPNADPGYWSITHVDGKTLLFTVEDIEKARNRASKLSK